MTVYSFFDDHYRNNLLPLTFTKPVSELRIGILTIREKWERRLLCEISSWKTQDYLNEKYPEVHQNDAILLNGHVCPSQAVADTVLRLKFNQGIRYGERIIAVRINPANISVNFNHLQAVEWTDVEEDLTILTNSWDLFHKNNEELKSDYALLTENRKSEPVPDDCYVKNSSDIFIEKGARIAFASLNASTGPIYIGAGAEIMEGALIRGPFSLGEHSTVHMGAKVYGPVSIGPHSKVGGELNNVNIQGFSNKGHDGFLGSSVVGEWCNIGADTNTSNLKNSYAEVKLWNYANNRFINTGLQFCGLIMGDHSKCGINTMFNAGTVVGICCNIHGTGYPRNFVPSFSDGGTQGYQVNRLQEVYKTAAKVMNRRQIDFSPKDQNIMNEVFEQTKIYRKF